MSYKYFILTVGCVVLLAACSSGKKPMAEVQAEEVLPEDIVELREDQIRLANIELGTIETKMIGNALKVNGIVSVSPQNQATVCMPLGGFVKSTNLLPGNAVRKGQVLAVIENQDFVDIQQNYLEAKNKLAFAEAEYKRHTALYKDDVYSEMSVQQVTVDYKNLKAQVRSMEQKLSMIGIRADQLSEENIRSTINLVSPINGYLKSVNVNVGKYVSPTDVLFEVVNSDHLLLDLTIFEKDANKVEVGQKIRFFINNETEEHEATITQTGKSVGDDKSFRAYATVSSTCKNVLPGMYVNAFITQTEVPVQALPTEAIVSFDNKDYIFVYEKDKQEDGKPFTEYRMVEVKKGVTGSGYTEVMVPEGFAVQSAKIVVRGAYNLLSAKKNAGEMAC